MARPKRGRKRTVLYLSPACRESLNSESKARKLPLGDIVEESLASRVVLIRKKPQ